MPRNERPRAKPSRHGPSRINRETARSSGLDDLPPRAAQIPYVQPYLPLYDNYVPNSNPVVAMPFDAFRPPQILWREDREVIAPVHHGVFDRFGPSVQGKLSPLALPLSPDRWRTRSAPLSPTGVDNAPTQPETSGQGAIHETIMSAPMRADPGDPPPPKPNAKAFRTGHALWLGNVPRCTEEELIDFIEGNLHRWHRSKYATREPPNSAVQTPRVPRGALEASIPAFTPGIVPILSSGIVSVFLMPHTHCAFVNFETEEFLVTALGCCDGVAMRPDAPNVVCQIRRDSHDPGLGVSIQRHSGVHKSWIKARMLKAQSQGAHHSGSSIQTRNTERLARDGDAQSESSDTTTDAFLTEHFPRRFFILKSKTEVALEECISTGMWRTQQHNETTLNRAFRTGKEVFLFFSANRSRCFHGYARMTGPIEPTEDDVVGLQLLTTASPTSSSPKKRPRARTSSLPSLDMLSLRLALDTIHGGSVSSPRQTTSESGATPLEEQNDEQNPITERPEEPIPDHSLYGLGDKETMGPTSSAVSPIESDQLEFASVRGATELGGAFRVQWLSIRPVLFADLAIWNAWNGNKHVRVGRDGLELDPNAGELLLAAWASVGIS